MEAGCSDRPSTSSRPGTSTSRPSTTATGANGAANHGSWRSSGVRMDVGWTLQKLGMAATGSSPGEHKAMGGHGYTTSVSTGGLLMYQGAYKSSYFEAIGSPHKQRRLTPEDLDALELASANGQAAYDAWRAKKQPATSKQREKSRELKSFLQREAEVQRTATASYNAWLLDKAQQRQVQQLRDMHHAQCASISRLNQKLRDAQYWASCHRREQGFNLRLKAPPSLPPLQRGLHAPSSPHTRVSTAPAHQACTQLMTGHQARSHARLAVSAAPGCQVDPSLAPAPGPAGSAAGSSAQQHSIQGPTHRPASGHTTSRAADPPSTQPASSSMVVPAAEASLTLAPQPAAIHEPAGSCDAASCPSEQSHPLSHRAEADAAPAVAAPADCAQAPAPSSLPTGSVVTAAVGPALGSSSSSSAAAAAAAAESTASTVPAVTGAAMAVAEPVAAASLAAVATAEPAVPAGTMLLRAGVPAPDAPGKASEAPAASAHDSIASTSASSQPCALADTGIGQEVVKGGSQLAAAAQQACIESGSATGSAACDVPAWGHRQQEQQQQQQALDAQHDAMETSFGRHSTRTTPIRTAAAAQVPDAAADVGPSDATAQGRPDAAAAAAASGRASEATTEGLAAPPAPGSPSADDDDAPAGDEEVGSAPAAVEVDTVVPAGAGVAEAPVTTPTGGDMDETSLRPDPTDDASDAQAAPATDDVGAQHAGAEADEVNTAEALQPAAVSMAAGTETFPAAQGMTPQGMTAGSTGDDTRQATAVASTEGCAADSSNSAASTAAGSAGSLHTLCEHPGLDSPVTPGAAATGRQQPALPLEQQQQQQQPELQEAHHMHQQEEQRARCSCGVVQAPCEGIGPSAAVVDITAAAEHDTDDAPASTAAEAEIAAQALAGDAAEVHQQLSETGQASEYSNRQVPRENEHAAGDAHAGLDAHLHASCAETPASAAGADGQGAPTSVGDEAHDNSDAEPAAGMGNSGAEPSSSDVSVLGCADAGPAADE